MDLKKRILKRIPALLMTAVLAAGLAAFGAEPVSAATPGWNLGLSSTMYEGQTAYVSVYKSGSYESGTLTSVTSGNPNIAAVTKESGGLYSIKAKAVGSTVVNAGFKAPGVAAGNVSSKLTVKKYPKQIKSLKVNGKKVRIKGSKRYKLNKKCSSSKARIKMQLKSGWKITSVTANYYSKATGQMTKAKVTKKMVKNGKAFKFPKEYNTMWVTVMMMKGSKYIFYDFTFWR